MPSVVIDGIATRYEVIGSGPPLLMYAPGGFNAVAEAWSTLGIYQKIKLIDHLPAHFTRILFDRRECGQSGGRVEPITWGHYVAQGKGLLEHLQIARAHLMGGCMGCAPVVAFAVAHPETVASMILYWPFGGGKYRISSHQRFAEHIGFVRENGLDRVVTLVRGRQAIRRRSVRRPVGFSDQKRRRFCRRLCAPRFATIHRNLRGYARRFVRPRHRARRGAQENACRSRAIGMPRSRRKRKTRRIRTCSNFCAP
jgi:pimeloyl-ACP methyl ester carboxylesterase